jgi:hypothetical protein
MDAPRSLVTIFCGASNVQMKFALVVKTFCVLWAKSLLTFNLSLQTASPGSNFEDAMK